MPFVVFRTVSHRGSPDDDLSRLKNSDASFETFGDTAPYDWFVIPEDRRGLSVDAHPERFVKGLTDTEHAPKLTLLEPSSLCKSGQYTGTDGTKFRVFRLFWCYVEELVSSTGWRLQHKPNIVNGTNLHHFVLCPPADAERLSATVHASNVPMWSFLTSDPQCLMCLIPPYALACGRSLHTMLP